MIKVFNLMVLIFSLALLLNINGYSGIANNIQTDVDTDVNTGEINESSIDADNVNNVTIGGSNNKVTTYNIGHKDGRTVNKYVTNSFFSGAAPFTSDVNPSTGVGRMSIPSMDIAPDGTSITALETMTSSTESSVDILMSEAGNYPSEDQKDRIPVKEASSYDRTQESRVGVLAGQKGNYAYIISKDRKLFVYKYSLVNDGGCSTSKTKRTSLSVPASLKSNVVSALLAKNTDGDVVIAVETTSGVFTADISGTTIKSPVTIANSVKLKGFAPYAKTGFVIAYSNASGVNVRRRTTFSGSFGAATTLASSANSLAVKMTVAKNNKVYVAFTRTNVLHLAADVFGTPANVQLALFGANKIREITASVSGHALIGVNTATFSQLVEYDPLYGILDIGNFGVVSQSGINMKVIGEAKGYPYSVSNNAIGPRSMFEVSGAVAMPNRQFTYSDILFDGSGQAIKSSTPYVRTLPRALYNQSTGGSSGNVSPVGPMVNQVYTPQYKFLAEIDTYDRGDGTYQSVYYSQWVKYNQ